MTTTEDVDLADAARAGLNSVPDGGTSQTEIDMDVTRLKFVGAHMSLVDEDLKIGDEVLYLVRARIIAVGDQERAHGGLESFATARITEMSKHDLHD